MNDFNTNISNSNWKIENKINFWKGHNWHNITITVNEAGQEAEYKLTATYPVEKIDEKKYWLDLGKKVAELFENIELKRRLGTVK